MSETMSAKSCRNQNEFTMIIFHRFHILLWLILPTAHCLLWLILPTAYCLLPTALNPLDNRRRSHAVTGAHDLQTELPAGRFQSRE
jgi:hypothetical protein